MKIKLCYSKRVVAYADFYEDFIRAKTNIAATGAKIVFEQIELAHGGGISAILEAEGIRRQSEKFYLLLICLMIFWTASPSFHHHQNQIRTLPRPDTFAKSVGTFRSRAER